MKFRNDIQILRGYAVLLVVLFHLGLSQIKSGFLGVDVFFVISGFLMAVLYDHNDKKNFFLRRANRLLPAYFVTIIATIIVAIFVVTPFEFQSVIKQSLFASIFSSNIGYWLENSYFSKDAFNPLLNLWSLGVEIQFYLIIPLLCFIFRKIKFSIFVVFVVSLSLCLIILTISPKTSFFMMPLRVWQFLIGFYIAKYLSYKGNVKFTNFSYFGLISLLGLFAIPFFKVDGESLNILNGHPGVFSIIVSFLTGIILLFGLPQIIEETKIGNIFISIGKYSYSIYLVHFPIIVLFLYQPFNGTILHSENKIDLVILLILIAIFSFLMYRYVESIKPKNITRKYIISICSISILLILGNFFQKMYYSEAENNIFNVNSDRGVYRCGKISRILHPTAIVCDLTPSVTKPTENILLVGNSHSDSIKQAFVDVAEKINKKVFFMVTNTPLMKGDSINVGELISEAKRRNISSIVLHYSPESIKSSTIKDLVGKANTQNINISLINPIPTYSKSVPKSLYENIHFGRSFPYITKSDYLKHNEAFLEAVKKIKNNNFKVYDVVDYFCKNQCQVADKNGKPYYFDGGHLTITGSHILDNLYKQVISNS
ncbi:acyltransferase [Shewanella sp. NFH-SH190041]|uniref:acyltransferase family protein n=1 Tax=Shewanella sp. NFH-SH190041 TaxID=2950245 RepID=UPI0021C482CA|nr:acyltransferase family protein [Shewanella sp. NFH-SH190041]BDM65159.1 acyltransferase [Shewanella sp. NFH-SH190041]